jgi:hypothetical protein
VVEGVEGFQLFLLTDSKVGEVFQDNLCWHDAAISVQTLKGECCQ